MDKDNDKKASDYSANNIQVLEGLEAVRKRPGMYIGNTGNNGLHHLVWEIVDNSIDEALAGYATRVEVTITADGSVIVKDDGRGIPVEIHKQTGKSTLETVLTVLHAGGKFDKNSYKVSGGLHGVGASVVNALSESLEAWVERDGNMYYQKFLHGGHPQGDVVLVGPSKNRGTTIKFKPDFTILEPHEFDFNAISDRLQQTAYLNRGLYLSVKDERTNKSREFMFKGGIVEYVQRLNVGKHPINQEIIYASGETEGPDGPVYAEIAFQYSDGFSANVVSYANNIGTKEGGTHEQGFFNALIRIFNNYAIKQKIFKNEKEKLQRDDIKEGLTAIISVKHANPVFEGQTKNKLASKDAQQIVNDVTSKQVERFLLENPVEARKMIEKSLLAQRARFAAQAAREATHKKSAYDVGSLPGKLADCSSKNAELSEIYIVEGDSAGGSAKLGRDRETQAILPLRGKVINAEKARIDKVFANNEIGTLITALGTSVGEEFNINKLRYHKVIIMTDADVDGAHIRTLLLTFFYRYLRKLIEYGFIYIAQPPLYKISTAKQVVYAYSDQEKNAFLKTLDPSVKFQIQRYKGLGEMDPEQLWETTMDPQYRKMMQVQIEDAAAADLTFSILMGDDVEPRRDFINENAKYVEVDV